jgi:hypothetical protein
MAEHSANRRDADIDSRVRAFPVFDPAKPSGARVWNYWSGGKDYFDADREVADQVLDVMPAVSLVARLTRQFLIRVVGVLAAEYGIRQFLDVGCGMPMPVNTHQAAAEAAPASRTVYTDIDPLAISHFRELLAGAPEGRYDCFQADVRDPDEILTRSAWTLDLRSPVALLLVTVLQNIPDADDPYGAVARLMAGLAPGSHLVLVHPPSDISVPIGTEIGRRYNAAPLPPVTMRSYADVTRFFHGLELIGPGLVNGPFWLTPDEIAAAAVDVSAFDMPKGMNFGYLGIARKPLCRFAEPGAGRDDAQAASVAKDFIRRLMIGQHSAGQRGRYVPRVNGRAGSLSSTWSGYADTGNAFSKVSARWKQPAASCSGGISLAAFWVGIDGQTAVPSSRTGRWSSAIAASSTSTRGGRCSRPTRSRPTTRSRCRTTKATSRPCPAR